MKVGVRVDLVNSVDARVSIPGRTKANHRSFPAFQGTVIGQPNVVLCTMLLKRVMLLAVILMGTTNASRTSPPGYSWATLPVHWFSSNSTSQLSPDAATRIASRHSLAIISGQGHAYFEAPIGQGAEGKMVAAARRLKWASHRMGSTHPISVLAYFNSVLDWTSYDFHTWIQAKPSRYLHGANGLPVTGRMDLLNNTLHIPDFGQQEVSDAWIANVVNTSLHMDGVFIDQGKWCSPFVCKDRPGVYSPGVLEAWTAGHWDMLLRLRAAIPNQILILNNLNTTKFPTGFDHEYEKFNGSVGLLSELQDDAANNRLAVCHNTGSFTTTLPLFLLGAGENAYSYYAAPFLRGDGNNPGDPGWVEPAWDGIRPEYTRKLGAPMGSATVHQGVATRQFASGTRVWMNLSAATGGCVYWSDGALTGNPRFCTGLD